MSGWYPMGKHAPGDGDCSCVDDGAGLCWLCNNVFDLAELEEWTRRERLRRYPWPFHWFWRTVTVTYLRCPGGCGWAR